MRAKAVTTNESEYLRRLFARQEAAQEALRDYVQYLFSAYGLRPGLDNIQIDGRIVRSRTPPPVALPPAGGTVAGPDMPADRNGSVVEGGEDDLLQRD